MVLFHTHLLIGITVFLLTKDLFSGGNQIIFFLMVLLGSILPDIDEGRSRINRWAGIFGSIAIFLTKHRGFFHSLLFFAISCLLIRRIWNFYYAAGLFMGYLAHIMGDGITRMGVRIFQPFSDFKINGPLRVGGFGEVILVVGLAVLIFLEFL